MVCAEDDGTGYVVISDPTPPSAASCTQFVLLSPSELPGPSPWDLDTEGAAQIGAAIALLWGAAFGLRMLRRALDT